MKPSSYEEWLALDPHERGEVLKKWNPYEGEGLGFVLCATGRLVMTSAYKIWEARPGIFHGGEWLIHAYVDKNDLAQLPASFEQRFEGFRVVWLDKDS